MPIPAPFGLSVAFGFVLLGRYGNGGDVAESAHRSRTSFFRGPPNKNPVSRSLIRNKGMRSFAAPEGQLTPRPRTDWPPKPQKYFGYGRTESNVKRLVRQITTTGGQAHAVVLDALYHAAVEKSIERITGHSWPIECVLKVAASLKRWWMAYITWRTQQAAVALLWSMSDRQLKDIGLTRSEITYVVKGDPTRHRRSTNNERTLDRRTDANTNLG
jgi:uncharacterized protein YjiS (DUF1127 family)